jgi:hypothetical protein
MIPLQWQQRLDGASTARDVLLVVNDFLDGRTREETARLPEDCRVSQLDNPAQVRAHAYALAHLLTAVQLIEPTLYTTSTFFTKAALRLFEIEDESAEGLPGGTAAEWSKRRGGNSETSGNQP